MTPGEKSTAADGVTPDVLRWLVAVDPERFAAWRAAYQGDDARALARESALVRTAFAGRVRFALWTGSALGTVLLVSRRPDRWPLPKLDGVEGDPPVFELAELAVIMAEPDRDEQRRLFRLVIAQKRAFPTAWLVGAGAPLPECFDGRDGAPAARFDPAATKPRKGGR